MDIDHEQAAMDHLSKELGADAPRTVLLEATFAECPLEGEGDMSVFSFEASIGGEKAERYFVVAGRTVANYYPGWGLTAEQVYELHLGTRFMLVMEVSTVPVDTLPPDLVENIRSLISTVAPAEEVSGIVAASAFRVDDATFAVCRARISGEEVYVLGLDCPPGIYREIHLPPHVILRGHLGRLIRREASTESRR